MKHITKRIAAVLCSAALLGTLAAGGPNSGAEESGEAQTPLALLNSPAADGRTPAVLDLTGATVITLSGGSASLNGNGAEVKGSVVTITAAGVYAVSGSLEDGRILVNAPKERVGLGIPQAFLLLSLCNHPKKR